MAPGEFVRRLFGRRPLTAERRLRGFVQKIGDALHRGDDDGQAPPCIAHVPAGEADRSGIADGRSAEFVDLDLASGLSHECRAGFSRPFSSTG